MESFLIKVNTDFLKYISQNIATSYAAPKPKAQEKYTELYASFDNLSGLIVGECANDPNIGIIIVPDNTPENQCLVWNQRDKATPYKKYTGTAVGEIRYSHGTSEYKIIFYPDTSDEYKNYVTNVVASATNHARG